MKPDRIVVRHYGPGGREHGGGIGRLIGYVVDAAAAEDLLHRVTDTRGRRLGLRSPAVFAAALVRMAADRAVAADRIHHIHMAGRGSTLRKIVLCSWARLLGCTHVLHLHDYDYATDYDARPGWQQALVRRMFQGADAVVVLGETDRRLATARLGVDSRQVVTLHNAVPDPGPPPDRTAVAPPGPASVVAPRIVFLGRLSERKGVPELLQALARPEMAAHDWHAVLAGDGPVELYRQQAEVLGLGLRVTMPGWLDQAATAALCRDAEILVLPSRAEGMSMAVLEGIAHGLAVVTTAVGSHGEAISDGETGLFVPVGDVPALAGCLAGLLADPARRRHLGAQARKHYLSEFSMAAYLRRLELAYSTVARGGLAAVPEEGHQL